MVTNSRENSLINSRHLAVSFIMIVRSPGNITTGFIGDTFVLEAEGENEELREVAIIAAALQTARRKRETVAPGEQAGGPTDLWKMAAI